MASRSKLSYGPALLAMAVAQASFAATVVVSAGADYTNISLQTVPSATELGSNNNANYTNVSGLGISTDGAIALGEDGGTVAPGYQVYYFSGPGAAGITIGPTDAAHTYISTSGGALVPYSRLQTIPAISSTGAVAGWAGRGGGSTSTSTYGVDAFLYIPGSANATIIGDQGILAVTPTGFSGNVYYSYTPNGASYATRNSNVTAINSNDQVIGIVSRYNSNGTNLGQDAYIYDPSAAAAANPVTIIGLTADSNYYSNVTYSNTTYKDYTITNTPVALNSSGAVVGISMRYPGFSSYGSQLSSGQDAWLYSAANATIPSGGSLEIGLTGNVTNSLGQYYSQAVTLNSAKTPTENYTYENSGVIGITGGGAVAGYSSVFANASVSSTANSTTITTIGQEAWVYAPSLAAGASTATATGYGTTAGVGTYTQVGLLTIVGQTASTVPNPTAGYMNANGSHSSNITAVSAAGYVVGVSTRYFSDTPNSSNGTPSTGAGQDAFLYDPSTGNSTLITPASSTYSNYVSSTGNSTSGSITVPLNSILLNNSSGGAAMAAGTQVRYAPGATTVEGTDAWAYSPLTKNTYVIASPAIIANFSAFSSVAADASNTEEFSSVVKGITDSGMVYGYFTPYVGTTTSTAQIGTYIFAWTQTTGTLLLTATTTAATVDTLTSAEWTSLLTSSVYADAYGDIFGYAQEPHNGNLFGVYELTAEQLLLGDANGDGKVDLSDLNIVLNNLGTTNSARSAGNFDGDPTIDLTDLNDVLNNLGTSTFSSSAVAAAPEPVSLSLLAAGGVSLLRRRRSC